MSFQPTMLVAVFTALTFSFGIPVFAEQKAAEPAAPAAEQHMDADHSAIHTESAEKDAKPNTMAKKEHAKKKAKKKHKKSGDES
jgi:hypothetical protein